MCCTPNMSHTYCTSKKLEASIQPFFAIISEQHIMCMSVQASVDVDIGERMNCLTMSVVLEEVRKREEEGNAT